MDSRSINRGATDSPVFSSRWVEVSNYCTFFPDQLNIPNWITYDIGGLCEIHDDKYDTGYPRNMADREFYDGLCQTYPEYRWLWKIVFNAVKNFGWFFYWSKRLGLSAKIQAHGAEKIKVAIAESLQRYAERETGQAVFA